MICKTGAVMAIVMLALQASCSDDGPALLTVPADIRPEDATFQYRARDNNPMVTIRMSSQDFCNKEKVTAGPRYVLVEVIAPNIKPGVYSASGDWLSDAEHAEIYLHNTAGEGCPDTPGAYGMGVERGTVTLDEVTQTVVRGHFEGTSSAWNLDLKGSFIATMCPDDANGVYGSSRRACR